MGPARARLRGGADDAWTHMIYLDNNATTPIRPAVLEAMLPYLKAEFGNASTVYQLGQRARKAIEDSREALAKFINSADPDEIIFTSGATEANNQVIKGSLEATRIKGNRIVSSAIEHSSVRTPLQHLDEQGKIENVVVPVQSNGLVQTKDIEEALSDQTILVSVIAANNEVGTLQPVTEIASLCGEKGIPFHTDAVQCTGKVPIDVQKWGVDMLSLSAHKFGGPKGTGLLYLRKGTRLSALLHGGRHEKNRRAGTENGAGIVGMAEAARQVMKEFDTEKNRVQKLRDTLEKTILSQIPLTFVNGHQEKRVPNTTNICFEYTESASMLMALDLKGLACSSGSACQSGSAEASHVLLAMGLPQDKAHASLRFSLGYQTTEEEIKKAFAILETTVRSVRETHPLWKEAVSQ